MGHAANLGPESLPPPSPGGTGADLTSRVSNLEGAQSVLKEQIATVYKGELWFFKRVMWFISIFAVLGGFFAVGSYKINEARLDDAIKRVDEALGKVTPSSLRINTLYGESINGKYDLRLESGHGGKDYFQLYIVFDVRVSTDNEHGIAKIVGVNASYSGDIVEIMSTGKNGADSDTAKRLQAGVFSAIGPVYVGSIPVEVEFSLYSDRVTCEGGQLLIDKLRTKKDIGKIVVTLLTDNPATNIVSVPFNVLSRESIANLTCNEYERKPKE